ncbi:hypothetical protein N7478_001262 [Penicillium angulare]|uniref:uncharacterized protein n=1 Tax=Penicillium angulare TaxID=116970 RepID=UPI002541732C|nr:uncharacterized protein N7478_001262 [Penicillium angulare]KAJ5292011.1 hypothetical protein N7478_001262 [Penicillium angulare]
MTAEESKSTYSGTSEYGGHPPSSITEDIYPVHTLDDIKTLRMFINWTMCFNDVLDPEKLHNSLSRLLNIGDWRKLGGRLRLKDDGKLEVYVPRPFTAEQQAVTFTHADFGMRIEEHPVACRFPRPTDRPYIQHISQDFLPFMARQNFPTTIEEMIRQKLPQISLHISSFSDATLVALTWPHTMMDAIGQQDLLQGWSLVLAGEEQKVPPFLGAREDILLEAENSTNYKDQGEFLLERNRLTGMSKLIFIVRFLWDKFWNPPREYRLVFLPRDTFERLQRRIQGEVAETAQSGAHIPFVSEGDILTAWVTRVVASSEPKPRPITVAIISNARFRLPLLINSEGVYIQNMLCLAFAFISSQITRGAAGPIALSHRRQIAEQMTEEQTLHLLKTMRRDIESRGNPRFEFGESNAGIIVFNNLTKADIIKAAHFGPAVLRQGEAENSRSNLPGTMKAFFARDLNMAVPAVNDFSMLGKDYDGNYWLRGNLLPRAWKKMEEELKNSWRTD